MHTKYISRSLDWLDDLTYTVTNLIKKIFRWSSSKNQDALLILLMLLSDSDDDEASKQNMLCLIFSVFSYPSLPIQPANPFI